MLGDFRYALRSLIRTPGFTAIAILALTLGIGASTAIFSVVNAVLLKPLPFPDADRLVMLWEERQLPGAQAIATDTRITCCRDNPINVLEWRSRSRSFDRMSAFTQLPVNLSGEGDPEQVLGLVVMDGFFETLGVRPLLGRTIRPEEDAPGNNNVAVLSHELWQRRWGGDRGVVGRRITMNNRLVEVVGVMPPGFRLPDTRAEVWLPLGMDREFMARTGRFLSAIARLSPGVSLDRARADMDRVAGQLRELRPEFNARWGVTVVALREQAVGDVRVAVLVLFGAVGFVLAIACANVANLLLIRATRREREIALRRALGASGRRVARQLLVESVTLAAAGGLPGALVAVWATRVLVAMIPASMSIHNITAVGVDRTVLLFTVAITIGTGVLFGVAPALKAGTSDPQAGLKEGARGVSTSRGRARAALVVAELALSMMLLVGAVLFIRSFGRLLQVNPGFASDHALTLRLAPGGRFQSPQGAASFLEQALERIRAVPEVKAAGSIHGLPLSGVLSATGFWRDDRPAPRPGDGPSAQTFIISPGYFAAMSIPVLSGRTFESRDRAGAPPVAIINDELARRYFPGENPVGKRLHVLWGADTGAQEIVGVVGSVRHIGLERPPEPALFLANLQQPGGSHYVVMRTSGDPVRVAAAVSSAIREIDRTIPVSEVRTMEEYLSRSVGKPRFNMVLIVVFASIALVLAAMGLFGVIAYSVAQRTQEIGIRRALGAGDARVVSMVLKEGMSLAAAGLVVGIAGALALNRVLDSLLFGVKATDAPTFAAVGALLAVVAFAACYVPARRASRVDPMTALRYE